MRIAYARREEMTEIDNDHGGASSILFKRLFENDDFQNTPGGVYTIGFIRAYSNYLNLNSNEIISQYKYQSSFFLPI